MDNDRLVFNCYFFDISVGWRSLIALGIALFGIAAIVYANHSH